MHTVIRAYSGAGTGELFDLIESRSDEVAPLLQGVPGFVNWSAVRSEGGGFTITVCQDKSGTDESSRIAREWIGANAAGIDVNPPNVYEGDVAMHF